MNEHILTKIFWTELFNSNCIDFNSMPFERITLTKIFCLVKFAINDFFGTKSTKMQQVNKNITFKKSIVN